MFRKIFDEGYDLCIDPDYNVWLNLNYPESLMDSSGSVVVEYLHITPPSPIPIDTEASSEATRVPVHRAFRREHECFNNHYTFRAI